MMWGLFQKKKKEVDESSSTTKLNELESKDYDVNKQTSLLFNAIRKKDIPLIKNLIENGADINKQARSGNTPLILAVQYQLQDIVELLLKKADVNIKNKYNKNALQIAESYGFYEIFWAIKIYMEP
ncbi:MAG TPA: ankyrin repeat domain-containing protein, partial [Bacteroidetes bacterium]|nr:ankyrin repeat domain-containing protein [Bacteroidota bacterium]